MTSDHETYREHAVKNLRRAQEELRIARAMEGRFHRADTRWVDSIQRWEDEVCLMLDAVWGAQERERVLKEANEHLWWVDMIRKHMDLKAQLSSYREVTDGWVAKNKDMLAPIKAWMCIDEASNMDDVREHGIPAGKQRQFGKDFRQLVKDARATDEAWTVEPRDYITLPGRAIVTPSKRKTSAKRPAKKRVSGKARRGE